MINKPTDPSEEGTLKYEQAPSRAIAIDAIKTMLNGCPLFEGMSETSILALANEAQQIRTEGGETLLSDEKKALYFNDTAIGQYASSKVEFSLQGTGKTEPRIIELERGKHLGEYAVCGLKPTGTIRTIRPTALIKITPAALKNSLTPEDRIQFYKNILRQNRLLEFTNESVSTLEMASPREIEGTEDFKKLDIVSTLLTENLGKKKKGEKIDPRPGHITAVTKGTFEIQASNGTPVARIKAPHVIHEAQAFGAKISGKAIAGKDGVEFYYFSIEPQEGQSPEEYEKFLNALVEISHKHLLSSTQNLATVQKRTAKALKKATK